MRARDVKEGAVLLLVWNNPDEMAYVKLGSKYLDAKRFRSFSSPRRASRIVYAGRSCPTTYWAWRLCHKEWRTVKGHTKDVVDMPLLCDESDAVHFTNLVRLVRGSKASRYPEG